MKLTDLDRNQLYTYADYAKWDFPERVELVRGKVFDLVTPNTVQHVLRGGLFLPLANLLRGTSSFLFLAPFDVILSLDAKEDTVLQPLLGVVCDPSKIEERGCIGAPDIVAEIPAPGNNLREIHDKFKVYEKVGVQEYWIIFPGNKLFIVNRLVNGKYITQRPMTGGDTLTTPLLPGFSIDLEDYFYTEMKKYPHIEY